MTGKVFVDLTEFYGSRLLLRIEKTCKEFSSQDKEITVDKIVDALIASIPQEKQSFIIRRNLRYRVGRFMKFLADDGMLTIRKEETLKKSIIHIFIYND